MAAIIQRKIWPRLVCYWIRQINNSQVLIGFHLPTTLWRKVKLRSETSSLAIPLIEWIDPDRIDAAVGDFIVSILLFIHREPPSLYFPNVHSDDCTIVPIFYEIFSFVYYTGSSYFFPLFLFSLFYFGIIPKTFFFSVSSRFFDSVVIDLLVVWWFTREVKMELLIT